MPIHAPSLEWDVQIHFSIGCDMRATDRKIRQLVVEEVAIAFNVNHLQAAMCLLVSAAISCGFLIVAVKHLF